MHCLDEKRLSSYLDEELSDAGLRDIEEHISQCNHCLDLLLVAYEARGAKEKCPALLKQKIREGFGLKQNKPQGGLKWLFGAIIFFALSFMFRKFFMQFLAASLILGFKWVMAGEAARRAIMIFKKIPSEGKKVERKSSSRVSDIVGGDRHGEAE